MNRLYFLIFLALLLPFPQASAQTEPLQTQTSVALTADEISFLETHPVIVLGTERSWEPNVVIAQDGSIIGYDAEILWQINALTGANFQLKVGAWREIQTEARDGQIDGLSTMAAHEERKRYLNFSDTYISLSKRLLVARGNPLSIKTRQDLAGKRIAIHWGNLHDEKIAIKFTDAEIIPMDSMEDTLRAVVNGDADATIGGSATLLLAQRLGLLHYLNTAFDLGEPLDLMFGVRNDWPEAISILNKGLRAIPEHERYLIRNRWFLVADRRSSHRRLVLTSEEKAYLRNKESIRICVNPKLMPYERLKKNGAHEGVFADIHRVLAKRLGVKLAVVKTSSWAKTLTAAGEKQCDILSAAVPTPDRNEFMLFTGPYLSIPIAIVTLNDQLFLGSISQLLDKTFAVVRGGAEAELLRQQYPDIKLMEVKRPGDGLRAVHDGKVFGFIGTLATIGYEIRSQDYDSMHIAGELEEHYEVAIGVRNDDSLLLAIYEKAVASLTDREIGQTLIKWGSIKRVNAFDYRLLWQILAVIAFLAGLAFYRYQVVSSFNRKLQAINKQLELLSSTDQLTGIANRRVFEAAAEKEIARAQRYGSTLSLIMTDIDHFKSVNDNYGHDTGDRVLVQFSAMLRNCVRDTDLTVRWGGEEFIILCPETDINGAVQLAEQLRNEIKNTDFGLDRGISASFGVSQYQDAEKVESLVKRADQALYHAKKSGRNRVDSLQNKTGI